MAKKKCKDSKGGIRPQLRYCGEPLDCIGVEKGDTFSEALVKINDTVCEGGGCDCPACGLVIEFETSENADMHDIIIANVSNGSGAYEYSWTYDQLPLNTEAEVEVEGNELTITSIGTTVPFLNINLFVTDTETGCTETKNFLFFENNIRQPNYFYRESRGDITLNSPDEMDVVESDSSPTLVGFSTNQNTTINSLAQSGVYEFFLQGEVWTSIGIDAGGIRFSAGVHVNNVNITPFNVSSSDVNAPTVNSFVIFKGNITLNAGDTIGLWVNQGINTPNYNNQILQHISWKLTQIL